MTDLIDRKEAIKVISNDSLDVKCFCVIGRGQENRELQKTINEYVDLLLETAKRKILSLPKADTERHGYWNLKRATTGTKIFKCSSCGYERFIPHRTHLLPDFCEKCGCKMDEVVE